MEKNTTGFLSLVKSLINEGYNMSPQKIIDYTEAARYLITNDNLCNWSCSIVSLLRRDGSRGIILESGDGFQSKVYEDGDWKDCLDNIFFMYHCLVK